MHAVVAVAPTTVTSSGFPVAVTIAVAVTALVAIGMVVVMLYRTMRPTRLTVGISLVSAVAVLIGALLVGGSLTQPPTAAAGQDRAPKGYAVPADPRFGDVQLPTL